MIERSFQLNRVFSRRLTPFLLKTPLTPNQVTLLSFAFGLLSGLAFSRGTYFSSLCGAFLLVTAYVLDNCDGEIARAKGLSSKFGGWLDVVIDLFTDFAFFAGLALGVSKQNPHVPAAALGGLCLAGSFVNFGVVVLQKIKGFGPAVHHSPQPEGANRRDVLYKIGEAFREGDSTWIVVLFCLFGKTEALLWVSAVYIQILWSSALVMNFRWLKTS